MDRERRLTFLVIAFKGYELEYLATKIEEMKIKNEESLIVLKKCDINLKRKMKKLEKTVCKIVVGL